jgi:hypothetical protein
MNITNYKCNRCDIYETEKFNDMKKHFNRKNLCKQSEKYMFLSDDQMLCMSLIPFCKNKENNMKHLENSNIISKNKKILFEELNKIERNKLKKCICCNKEFNLIYDLKKHFIMDCFLTTLNKPEIKIINQNINSNNNNSYNINITNNIYVDSKPPLSFDNNWNLSQISESERSNIMISNYMYTKLLEEILKNEINLNVIIDKDKESGMVYKDDKYIQMKLKDIIENTMKKLNNHLNEINKEHTHAFDEIIKYTRRMINKKYDDYNNNSNIQEGVKKCMAELFESKKSEAINIAKNVCEKNKNSENIIGF